MGWFKKKSDPISERARALNDQIAQLEAQIRDLSNQPLPEEPLHLPSTRVVDHTEETAAKEASPPEPAPAPAQGRRAAPKPKLRSTAFPQGPHVPAANSVSPPPPAETVREPVFERVPGNPFKGRNDGSVRETKQLDVRKSDLGTSWRRFVNHFRGPGTSNPKLVNYLAAGSIQGLRPLRYEKRVARNRTILLLAALIIVLWGILALVMRG